MARPAHHDDDGLLTVEELRVAYGSAVAVDGVDLTVAAGEVVALLGPSGCGKSTILRAIAGLVATEAGRIRLARRDLAGVGPADREVGLMFQDYALFPHRNVIENVAFGPRMRGLDRRAARARATEALALVGLRGFEERSIASLSGGEQQRVALARTLAPEPRMLLLDEPLGSLDRALRERLTVELRELFVRLGSTVLTVTHDQGEAFGVADRVVLVRAGRVVQSGTPLEVWGAPVSSWAARFLGFANVLAVEVVGGTARSPWGPLPCGRPDGAAALVIRPAALRFCAGDPDPAGPAGAPGAGTARGVAGPARFRGEHVAVPVLLVSGEHLEVVVRDQGVPATGEGVHVALDPARAVFVDP